MTKRPPLAVPLHGIVTALLLAGLAFCAAIYLLSGPPARAATVASPALPNDTPTATPIPDCALAWRIFPNPTPLPPGETVLFGVAPASATDAWAVGYYGSPSHTLVERWDGTSWSVVNSPQVGDDWLSDVAVVSPTDVWAIGFSIVAGGVQPLAIHWQGSTWTVVPTPNRGSTGALLETISVVAANDIWAVGYGFNPSPLPFIVHWDGSTWTDATPPGYPSGGLHHVSAAATNDVWAAGGSLVLHYNGTGWTQASLPPISGMWLSGVKAFAPNDAWVVGSSNSSAHTLALHWDGAQWAQVTTPDPPGGVYNELFSVQGIAPNDVWALGRLAYGSSDNLPLVLHYDGSAWSLVDAPQVQSLLQDVAPVSATDVWAVGANEIPNNRSQLIERYSYGDSGCATVTPAGTPTRTATPITTSTSTATLTAQTTVPPTYTRTATTPPATATSTATSTVTQTAAATTTATATATATATTTATATATSCTINFTDVQPEDYFYEPVRYLYCAGAVSGYPDGTFRPYNTATRAQAAKIVVLAEGWELQNPAEPTFNDVEPGSTFYTYIETAVAHEIINGYPDGAFRPQNNITRGQISKMVVLAEGWPQADPATPTFWDVPVGSTFFSYVETAFAHGIINGYPDGSFKPNNNALRGQISKIVYLSRQSKR